MSTTEISMPQVAKATTEIDELISSWKKEMDNISELNDTLMTMWKEMPKKSIVLYGMKTWRNFQD